MSTEVFLFTSCGDYYSVPTAGVSQEEIQNKQPEKKYEIASFLEHGSQESGMLTSEPISFTNNTTWKYSKTLKLQLTARIPGLENAADSSFSYSLMNSKGIFEYANII